MPVAALVTKPPLTSRMPDAVLLAPPMLPAFTTVPSPPNETPPEYPLTVPAAALVSIPPARPSIPKRLVARMMPALVIVTAALVA